MTIRDHAQTGETLGVGGLPRRILDHARGMLSGEDARSSTSRAALLAFLIRVASAGIAYFSQVLLARWMGSFEYGIFVVVWVWVLILGGLAPLGLSVTAIRFVAAYRETGQYALLRGLLLNSRAIGTGVSIAMMLTALGAVVLFGDALDNHFVLPAFLVMFCLPAFTLVDVQDGIARGFGWMDVALVSPYILRPLLTLAAMAAAYMFALPMTAVTAAGAAVVGSWLAALAQTIPLERRARAMIVPGPREYASRFWLMTSIPLLMSRAFELLLQNTDVLVLSHYVPPGETGIYFAALKTIGLVAFVHFAVGTAAAHRFSMHQARGDAEGLAELVRYCVRWTFWPTLAGAVVLLALGRPLLWLFGPEFTAGHGVMLVLAAGFVLRAAAGPAEFILTMLGQQKACAVSLCLAAALNLILNVALVPPLGLYGAALATAISLTASAIVMVVVAKRRLGLNILIGR